MRGFVGINSKLKKMRQRIIILSYESERPYNHVQQYNGQTDEVIIEEFPICLN